MSAPDGFEATAIGGTVLASDSSEALVYVDRGTDPWIRGDVS